MESALLGSRSAQIRRLASERLVARDVGCHRLRRPADRQCRSAFFASSRTLAVASSFDIAPDAGRARARDVSYRIASVACTHAWLGGGPRPIWGLSKATFLRSYQLVSAACGVSKTVDRRPRKYSRFLVRPGVTTRFGSTGLNAAVLLCPYSIM